MQVNILLWLLPQPFMSKALTCDSIFQDYWILLIHCCFTSFHNLATSPDSFICGTHSCSTIPFVSGIRKVFLAPAPRNEMKMVGAGWWGMPLNCRLHPILLPSVSLYDGHSFTCKMSRGISLSCLISCSFINLKRQL